MLDKPGEEKYNCIQSGGTQNAKIGISRREKKNKEINSKKDLRRIKTNDYRRCTIPRFQNNRTTILR